MTKIFKVIVFLFAFLLQNYFASGATDTINIRNLKSGISLDESWKVKEGDDKKWATIDYDDSEWKFMRTDTMTSFTRDNTPGGIYWYRNSFVIDSLIEDIPLAFELNILGAADIFVDGRLIKSAGQVGKTVAAEISGFTYRPTIIPIPFNNSGIHYIAVRSSNYGMVSSIGIINVSGNTLMNFDLKIISMQKALEELEDISSQSIPIFFSGVFIVLSFFHMILFLYYRKNRSNLYYSLFTFFLFAVFFAIYLFVSGVESESCIAFKNHIR